MNVCPKCNNTRHVFVNGKVRRCECIKEAAHARMLADAGVHPAFCSGTLADLRPKTYEKFAACADRWFADRSRPSVAMLKAKVTNVVGGASIAYVIRSGVERALATRYIRLTELIDAQFDRDRKFTIYGDIAKVDVLILDMDVERAHAYVPQCCMDVYTRRANLKAMTVFYVHEHPEQLTGKYGGDFCALWSNRRHPSFSIASTQSGRRA